MRSDVYKETWCSRTSWLAHKNCPFKKRKQTIPRKIVTQWSIVEHNTLTFVDLNMCQYETFFSSWTHVSWISDAWYVSVCSVRYFTVGASDVLKSVQSKRSSSPAPVSVPGWLQLTPHSRLMFTYPTGLDYGRLSKVIRNIKSTLQTTTLWTSLWPLASLDIFKILVEVLFSWFQKLTLK